MDEVTFSGSFTDPSSPSHVVGWDFGDGSPAVIGTLTPTHAYAHHGVYTVTLIVTDSHLASASDTLTVTVISAFGCASEALETLTPYVMASKRIEKAAQAVAASLAQGYWTDEVHVQAKEGHKVLNEWHKATQELQQALKDAGKEKLSAAAASAVPEAITQLLCAAKLLAETVYLENEGLVAAQLKHQKSVDHALAQAKAALDQGDAEATAGKNDNAVQSYRQSWEKTQEALELAAKTD